MFINIADKLEYREELLEWEKLYCRLKKMIDAREGEEWKQKSKEVDIWWGKMRMFLKDIYGI